MSICSIFSRRERILCLALSLVAFKASFAGQIGIFPPGCVFFKAGLPLSLHGGHHFDELIHCLSHLKLIDLFTEASFHASILVERLPHFP
jgi:hypothetical protein